LSHIAAISPAPRQIFLVLFHQCIEFTA
jgi:hypothetical protein